MRMRAEEVLRLYKNEDLPEFVEILLTDVNQHGNFGNTPLHVASVRGNSDEVEALLAADADVNASGELGNTPLHDAAGQGHVEIVKQLLQRGATTKAVNADGKTAREVASLMQRHDVVEAIDLWLKKKSGQ